MYYTSCQVPFGSTSPKAPAAPHRGEGGKKWEETENHGFTVTGGRCSSPNVSILLNPDSIIDYKRLSIKCPFRCGMA